MASLFGGGKAPSFEQLVESATSDRDQEDDWALIMTICDEIKEAKDGAKNGLKAIFKRLNHRNQTVSSKALTILDACVSNCGRRFISELGSREYIQELRKIANSSDRTAEKLRNFVKKWAEGDLKTESSIVQLHKDLKSGSTVYSSVTFSGDSKSGKSSSKLTAQQLQEKEIEELARAMALSMQETQGKQNNQSSTVSSLYPTASAPASTPTPASVSIASTINSNEPRKVRALYDFEAAEDNELTFKTGDVIFVLDDSDANWWRGYTANVSASIAQGEGLLFPSNFVTSDLAYQPAPESAKKESVEEAANQAPVDQTQVVIDEAKIDKGLSLIQEADPTGEQRPDGEDLLRIEQECRFMAPMVDVELEKVDALHAKLTDANQALVDAFAEYHRLMAQEVSNKQKQQIAMPSQYPPQYYDPNSSVSNFIPTYGVPIPGAPGAVTYNMSNPVTQPQAIQQQQPYQAPQQFQQQFQQVNPQHQMQAQTTSNGFSSAAQVNGGQMYNQQPAQFQQSQHPQATIPMYNGVVANIPNTYQPAMTSATQQQFIQQPSGVPSHQ